MLIRSNNFSTILIFYSKPNTESLQDTEVRFAQNERKFTIQTILLGCPFVQLIQSFLFSHIEWTMPNTFFFLLCLNTDQLWKGIRTCGNWVQNSILVYRMTSGRQCFININHQTKNKLRKLRENNGGIKTYISFA